MKTHFLPCLKLTFLTMILFGVIYPLAITGIAALTSPGSGDGETLKINGKVVGFELIGQSFKSEKYFNGRPSAVNYNAAATGGSNKGPSNPDYLTLIDERISDFLTKNPDISRNEITIDMVTASGGGLDPHISSGAAMVQVPRIAKARGIPEAQLTNLVNQFTDKPLLGLFGPSHVHVLKLNIELDQLNLKK